MFKTMTMEALPKSLQESINKVIKVHPDSKQVFQELIAYYEPLQRKVSKTFNCVISKAKLDKLPSDLYKIQTSKKRKLLFTVGKKQQMFTCDSTVEENAVAWSVLEEIPLMHSGKMYL